MTRPAAPGDFDVVLIRAANPGPFTLSGTNTWVCGREPAWVIDPGPSRDEHVAAVVAEVDRRGGLGGVVLTHGHHDHSEGVAPLLERRPAPVAAAGWPNAERRLSDGEQVGPLRVLAAPGHARDHLAFIFGEHVAFTGDAVLGEGSVFVAPGPGSLTRYLAALERLRALPLRLLCPGHGPPVSNPAAKLDEYLDHRQEREDRLVAALAAGRRTVDELLDDAWSDAPAVLRPAAEVTLAAHLDKLDEEGRLPMDVQRPETDRTLG